MIYLWISLVDYLECKKIDTILVVVDRLSKFSHFIALSHLYTDRNQYSINP